MRPLSHCVPGSEPAPGRSSVTCAAAAGGSQNRPWIQLLRPWCVEAAPYCRTCVTVLACFRACAALFDSGLHRNHVCLAASPGMHARLRADSDSRSSSLMATTRLLRHRSICYHNVP